MGKQAIRVTEVVKNSQEGTAKALYDGTASPDDFVQKFVIGKGAKADDVKELAKILSKMEPESMEVVRGHIAQYLKAAATGQGTADEVGKFSASGFRKAMQSIGRQKMSAFFNQNEMEQLQSIMRVANYTSAQPVGSAVNNSNSGALLVGKGLDMLDRLAGTVLLMQVFPTANNLARSAAQRSAQNITPALAGTRASSAAGLAASPMIATPRTTHDPSQRADRDVDEYQYARTAALQAGDYDAVRILDEDARLRGYIR